MPRLVRILLISNVSTIKTKKLEKYQNLCGQMSLGNLWLTVDAEDKLSFQ